MSAFQSLSHNKGVIALLLILLISPVLLSAEYTIDSFAADINVSATGVYEIREHATLTFLTPMHGFYRTIPTGFSLDDGRNVYARISKIRANDDMKVESSRYETVIRLGSADKTVTGSRDYTISYRYDLGEDLYDDRDEFYFDVVGTEWDQPISFSSFSITFPAPVSRNQIEVYRGMYGSVSTQGVTWSLSQDGTVLTGKADDLIPGEGVTVLVSMQDGYFAERPNYTYTILPLLIIAIAGSLLLAFRWWSRYGKDTPPVIVPRYTPPDTMSPLDVGYLIDRNIDAHDLTSMIFYWADRGNLTIVEEKKKFTFVKGGDLKDPSPHEQKMFSSFFALGKNGVVTEKDLKNTFYKVFQEVKSLVTGHYSKERALVNKESTRRSIYILLLAVLDIIIIALTVTINLPDIFTFIIVVFFVGYLLLNTVILYRLDAVWYKKRKAGKILMMLPLLLLFILTIAAGYLFSFINGSDFASALFIIPAGTISIAVLSFVSIITRQRSEYGQKRLEEVLGLKDFIETVEMDELKTMIDSDPEFYYRILSFAIVLGLERKWARKFSSFSIDPPNWYSGNRALVGSMMVSSVIRSCDSALVSHVAPPKSSSSSGGHFGGGGGFSGGGFGGGGGGAW